MRIIDADYLYDLIDGGFDIDFDETPETKRELLRMVKEAPTIDAVPVVRCKDCIYFHDYGDGVKNCWGDGGGIFTKDDDFCSHAERKDE